MLSLFDPPKAKPKAGGAADLDLVEAAAMDDPDPKVTRAVAALPPPQDGVDFSDALVGSQKAAGAGEVKGDLPGHEFHGNQYTGGMGRRANGGKAALRKAVDEVAARAKAAEPKITADLFQLAERMGGDINFLRPDGARALDMRLKSRESLNRKIRDGAEAAKMTYAEKAAEIKDAVRYTMLVDPGKYTNAYQGTIDSLRQQGYTVAESDIKNYWPDGNVYRGLNVAATSPDGQRFELQFHTPDSLRTKEVTLHPIYEEVRDPHTAPSRRDELTAQMRQISAMIPTPPGIIATDHVRIE